MTYIQYRWMEEGELDRLSEIDRSERIRTGYSFSNGTLKRVDVHWDTPTFSVEDEGEHSVAAQIAFCREHLRKGGRMFGAFADEKMIGIGVILLGVRQKMAQLAYLHVGNTSRRKGVGSFITRELIQFAKHKGSTGIYISATPSGSAVGFYLSHGFVPTNDPIPELFEDEPEDIHMTLQMAP